MDRFAVARYVLSANFERQARRLRRVVCIVRPRKSVCLPALREIYHEKTIDEGRKYGIYLNKNTMAYFSKDTVEIDEMYGYLV